MHYCTFGHQSSILKKKRMNQQNKHQVAFIYVPLESWTFPASSHWSGLDLPHNIPAAVKILWTALKRAKIQNPFLFWFLSFPNIMIVSSVRDKNVLSD